jgi:Flp pilus assembly protein TadD
MLPPDRGKAEGLVMAQGAGALEALFAQAVRCFNAGDGAGAESACRRLLAIDRHSPPAHQMLGALCLGRGEAEQAVKHFSLVVKAQPRAFEAQVNLGLAHRAEGKLPQAVRCFREAVRLRPDVADVHALLGNALVESGRPGEAVPVYEQALRLAPAAIETHVNLGQARLALNQPDAPGPG